MEKVFVYKIKTYCFDKGNDGLICGTTFNEPQECELSEEAIVELMKESGLVLKPSRFHVVEHFSRSSGLEQYRSEMLSALQGLEDGEDEDDCWFPDMDEYFFSMTKRKIEKYAR